MENNIEISPFGNNLMFKSGYTKDFVFTTLKERHLDGIKINTRWENLVDLSFLSDYQFLESLDIVGVRDFDFSFLLSLKKLKKLSISIAGNNEIDLSNQTNLESLSIQWRKGKILGVEKCVKITSLCLVDYSEKDFIPVSSLRSLEVLKVKTALVNNCDGLENLTKLKSILLGNCKKLSSLEGLGKLNNVTSISFDLCPQIKNYDEIGNLHKLEDLQITDCKGVGSIKFIESLVRLEKLSLLGNTDILDGDLMPAKKVKEVFYMHRNHYNVTIDNKEYDSLVKNNLNKLKGLFK
jgi:hypothetical protein